MGVLSVALTASAPSPPKPAAAWGLPQIVVRFPCASSWKTAFSTESAKKMFPLAGPTTVSGESSLALRAFIVLDFEGRIAPRPAITLIALAATPTPPHIAGALPTLNAVFQL